MLGRSTILSMVTALSIVTLATELNAQATNDHTVLILGESVTDGSLSREATAASALGYDVHIVTDDQWGDLTASDFATYRAIIIGDPTCVYGTSAIDGAMANNSTWGPELDGNVVIIGSDPVFHATNYSSTSVRDGAIALIEKTMAFVLALPNDAGKTGAYISLGCAFDPDGYGTPGPVALLDYVGEGGFVVEDTECHNDARITAFHPALDGLTDAKLSNWHCSIHSVFSSWDTENFKVLAIGDGLGSTYVDAVGSGSPFILAKGICSERSTISVSLTPDTLWSPNNSMVNIEATVTSTGMNATVELVSITSDEGDEANDVANATTGTADFAFQVRRQRDGNGDGRVYTVTYRVTDDCVQEVEASATIVVPHDQGH